MTGLWRDLPVAAIEIETSGLNRQTARVIEIGIACYDNGKPEKSYLQRINPGGPMPKMISDLTGITNEDLAGKPQFKDVANDILDCLNNRLVLVYNADFEMGFLGEAHRQSYRG